MTKEEILLLLREELRIEITKESDGYYSDESRIVVTLFVGDEQISSDYVTVRKS